MAVFSAGYMGDIDRAYYASPSGYLGEYGQSFSATETRRQAEETGVIGDRIEKPVEKPVISAKEIGMSVTEGARFGSLLHTTQGAIRKGVGKIELATIMGGNEPGGAESYGKEARQALREVSKANQVEFTSVHSPTQVGNLSGYNPQERGFNDEHRKVQLEEVKRAIGLAADVGGGGVVVHTGEFQRDISTQPWAINPDGTYKFLSFEEEPGRQVLYMVDDRNGKLISEVRKSQVVREPEFETVIDENGFERFVDKEGRILDESNPDDLFLRIPKWNPERKVFESNRLTWDKFVERARKWDALYPKGNGENWTAEEMFFRSQMETRMLQFRGSSLYHAQRYDDMKRSKDAIIKALKFYEELEGKIPVEEQWKLFRQDLPVSGYFGGKAQHFVQPENKLPSQILKEALEDVELHMKFTHESSASSDAQADDTYETMQHVKPVREYAIEQTTKSYAELGIDAMNQSLHNKNIKKDVFVAPENIFPEMGFGSHPEEMIELVRKSRQKMVEYLTAKQIKDPVGRFDEQGKPLIINNPYYTGMEKEEAEKYANRFVRATLDTQHLGMWWKHFQAKSGETIQQRKERFDKWYMEQIDKMEKEDIIGHIHVVDSMGGGHHHLPVGQGDLPVKKAVEYLAKKGFKGTMISEGHEEDARFGAGRQITKTWEAFGSPIRSAGYALGAPERWPEVHHTYFRQLQNPYFIFGAYSPSNDWQLWSQVPME